jgi:hypothetical protein
VDRMDVAERIDPVLQGHGDLPCWAAVMISMLPV